MSACARDDGSRPSIARSGHPHSSANSTSDSQTSSSWPSPWSQLRTVVTKSSVPYSLREHSQTVATLQPASIRDWRDRSSRSIFLANLSAQNSGLVEGLVAFGQPGCRCQKHPCTKTTAPNFGNTRSGLPGRSFRWIRYRSPAACSALRSLSSGRVFRPRIPDIIRDLVC